MNGFNDELMRLVVIFISKCLEIRLTIETYELNIEDPKNHNNAIVKSTAK